MYFVIQDPLFPAPADDLQFPGSKRDGSRYWNDGIPGSALRCLRLHLQ